MAQRIRSEIKDEIRSYWQDQFKAYEESGSSQREFCKVNGICLSTFRNWRKKLSGNPGDNLSFVEIGSEATATVKSFEMELAISEGLVLRIGEGIVPEKIALIIKSLMREG